MKVLFIGDIVGKIGRLATKALLPAVTNRYKIDLVIANGENAAGGFGITDKIVAELMGYGVHVITTGNHVWDKKEFIPQISKEGRVLRPLNYPPGRRSAPACTSRDETAKRCWRRSRPTATTPNTNGSVPRRRWKTCSSI